MLWSLNSADPAPLHEQIAAAVRRAVVTAELAPGERLPTARQLADAVEVDPNTVLRAYRTLRTEGVLEFRRGRGVSVASRAVIHGEVATAVRELYELGRRHGYSRPELIRLIEEYP